MTIQMFAFGCFLRKNFTIFSESSQIQFLALELKLIENINLCSEIFSPVTCRIMPLYPVTVPIAEH